MKSLSLPCKIAFTNAGLDLLYTAYTITFGINHYISIGLYVVSLLWLFTLKTRTATSKPIREKLWQLDDGEILNAKVLLLSSFLIFIIHWPILSKIISLLTSKLSSLIHLLGLLVIISLGDVSTEKIGSNWEFGKYLQSVPCQIYWRGKEH